MMGLPRRRLLQLAAGAAASLTISRTASAQSYPSRTVRILVGFPAGGTTDIAARLVAQALSERLGQQFIVENRPGASTNIATEAVVRSQPDGYTLLAASTSNTVNASLDLKLNFSFVRDIVMVAGMVRSPLVLEVHPSVPVQTVSEVIAYAKANPGALSMASFGTGTSSHVTGELFKMMSGVDMPHVPYRGSAPLVTDLIAGQVHCAFDNLPASIEQIRAGRLRALAVSTATREPSLPGIPTVGETLPSFEASAWIALGAPRNTPPAIVETLNREINAALADPKLQEKAAVLGATVLRGSPADFAKLIADETEKWAKVIKFAGIKAE
jgi:tripartite-type tricarboxylate transporter receptor subunit TctC